MKIKNSLLIAILFFLTSFSWSTLSPVIAYLFSTVNMVRYKIPFLTFFAHVFFPVYVIIAFALQVYFNDLSIVYMSSAINVFLTCIFILTLRYNFANIDGKIFYFSVFVISTVFISFVISFLPQSLIITLGIRTNEVLGLNRLTYFFLEPSHYGLFLAISVFILFFSPNLKYRQFFLIVSSIALVLTWSLSGFIFLIILYFIYYFFYKAKFLYFFYLALSLLMIYLLWYAYLSKVDFWLVYKVNSLIDVIFNQQVSFSSAFLRFTSISLSYTYLIEMCQVHLLNCYIGEGFGNSEGWISNYYNNEFGFVGVTESFNFFSSVIITQGFVGFLVYLFLIYFTIPIKRVYNIRFLLFSFSCYLLLSFFSGYAYGALSWVFYTQLALFFHVFSEYLWKQYDI